MEIWSSALDRGDAMDVINLDFRRESDLIPLQGLLNKWMLKVEFLEILQHGMGFAAFQKIEINYCFSEWNQVQSGKEQYVTFWVPYSSSSSI
jgi:hypothetical protein